MMRTCFVHIGMHKTGSTAIQAAFHGYNDGKIAMLDLGRPNHSWPMQAVFSSGVSRAREGLRNGVKADDIDATAASLRNSIITQFQASTCDFIITGEGLSTRLSAADIADLKVFLANWFQKVQVIIYFRDPASFMRSAFQQLVKGSELAFDLDLVRPNYRKRTRGWMTQFGKENVTVVLYDRKAFAKGSVVHDFAQRIGVEVSHVSHVSKNESLHAEGLAICYAIRNELAEGNLSLLRWAGLRADLLLAPNFGTRKFDFSETLIAEALDKQKEDIAWAEEMMKQPFPVRKRTTDAVEFGSHEDLLQYGRNQMPHFDIWKRKNFSPLRRLRYLVRGVRIRLRKQLSKDAEGVLNA